MRSTLRALAVVLAGAVLAASTSMPQAPSPAPASRTQVVLLGTGTPNAEPDRSGSAVAVLVDQVPYLIDAGPGVVFGDSRVAVTAFAVRHGAWKQV